MKITELSCVKRNWFSSMSLTTQFQTVLMINRQDLVLAGESNAIFLYFSSFLLINRFFLLETNFLSFRLLY